MNRPKLNPLHRPPKKYDPLLDDILENCLEDIDKDIPYIIEISTDVMKLATIKKGLIKAKSDRTLAGKLAGNLRLIFWDEKEITGRPNFQGFAVSLQTISKLTEKDI